MNCKHCISLSLALLIIPVLFSQETVNTLSNWMKFNSEERVDPALLFERNSESFALSEDDKMSLYNHSTDAIGIEHFRFQQYHKGVKVEGGEYLFHRSGKEIWGNGRLVFGIQAQELPSLTEEQALQSALAYFNADSYFWEDPIQEELIKVLKQDENASFFPEGELIYGEEKHTQDGKNYLLLWKFEIYAFGEKAREFVYVNALDGSIAYTIEGMHSESTEGIAQTRYHGEQSIISDSISANVFQLRDMTRGGGINVVNLQESETLTDSVQFVDEDNYWDNANEAMDEVAGDVHWGLEMVYDYYLMEHGRDSYDDEGGPILAYVHYGQGVFNAFWVGLYGAFGDGDDNPLTYIDVIAHEFSHGVTKTSAGLIYSYETGALNESFSDIFGQAIEFYAYPDSASWEVGIQDFVFRNMADPNVEGDPDTYLGDYWYGGSLDYGGAHTNSGVQNYWYYLLCEGGSGVNDNDDSYAVESIGMDKASDIAYRNLTQYLSTTSTYNDARQGSIQSAIDLYGECSNEVEQVINAWHAVGLGSDNYDQDLEMLAILSPQNDCDLSEEEIVEVNIKYHASGCESMISAGESIEISYQLDENDPVSETYILSEDLNEGDSFNYAFMQTISLPEMEEEYELDVWLSYSGDLQENNNSLLDYEIERKFDHGAENMGFESLTASRDSFYVVAGKHAQGKISSDANNTGNRGFMMTAYRTTQFLVNFADDPSLNFEQNPEYMVKICFCVDAQEWDNVQLDFDMKQTYSKHYMNSWGNDSAEYASSMRMLINGEQFGEQFHPTDYTEDPYLTYNYNLDQLAGSYFEFCFQSKNFINRPTDPVEDSDGDNTYLDNVKFYTVDALSINENSEVNLKVYPNPAKGFISIQLNDNHRYRISIMDMQGREVYIKNSLLLKNEEKFDLRGLASGMYTLRVYSEENEYIEKILID